VQQQQRPAITNPANPGWQPCRHCWTPRPWTAYDLTNHKPPRYRRVCKSCASPLTAPALPKLTEQIELLPVAVPNTPALAVLLDETHAQPLRLPALL